MAHTFRDKFYTLEPYLYEALREIVHEQYDEDPAQYPEFSKDEKIWVGF